MTMRTRVAGRGTGLGRYTALGSHKPVGSDLTTSRQGLSLRATGVCHIHKDGCGTWLCLEAYKSVRMIGWEKQPPVRNERHPHAPTLLHAEGENGETRQNQQLTRSSQ